MTLDSQTHPASLEPNRRRRWRTALVGILGLGLVATTVIAPWSSTPAEAALTGLPPGFLDERVVGDLPFPTAVSFTPSGDMFIALKSGVVRIVDDGVLLEAPFIDLSEIVHDNDDRGLLGLTVHPQFPEQPYLYLAYTYDPPGTIQDQGWPVAGRLARVERFTADAATGYATAVEGSGLVLVGTNSVRENIGNENDGRDPATVSCVTGGTMAGVPIQDCLGSDENSHTIGTVAFAPDGSLLITNGDGANYNSPDPRALLAQNLDSLAGKVLRINPETGSGQPDNPFFDPAAPDANRSKVWSYGLRNPFRMAIEPTSGTPWVGDVGWGAWEEINTGKGANFGWPCYEGGAVSGSESAATTSLVQSTYSTNLDTSPACGALYAQGLSAVAAPMFSYDHSGGGASANAGAFYSGVTYPEQYRGALFIADYDRRWIRALTVDASGAVDGVLPFAVDTSGASGPVQLIAGPDTNLYWVKYSSSGGEIRRIRYVGAGNVPPTAISSASPTAGVAPLEVAFSAANSYDVDATPLRYTWDFDDGTPSSNEIEPVHVFSESGLYRVKLTVTEDILAGQSSETTIVITVGADPPMASIDPLPQAYAVGDIIPFSGRGTALDDPIPAANHSWQLRQGHNQHWHYATPVWETDPGDPNMSRGTFEVDEHGDETSYELCLTVTASSGLQDTACASTQPNRVEYTVLTEPVGMSVSYEDEGLELQGPAIIRPIEGSRQTLSVAPIQNHRTFVGWSDSVTARSRTFVAGDTPTSFTALFENRTPTASIASHSSLTGPAPLTVHATAVGLDPEGDELTYEWTVDGTVIGTGATPVLEFDSPGERTVVLTARDSLGATATDTMQVSVTGPPVGFADLTYVSDLELLEASNGYGPIEVDTTNGGAVAGDGVPITIAGAAFARGLGVHAASSASVVLGGSCSQFGAVLGVDDT
ncbi:MAG TPA: PQQ-dependent sugar dehydrogenase, partial [Ilumatobacteraceae bacterium]|nr:PQQ-dependent sugar dehydrogenase [Ilumatobacteraceae bacterium]